MYPKITPKPDKVPLECATFVWNPCESCDTDFTFSCRTYFANCVTTRDLSHSVLLFGERCESVKQISTLNDQLIFVKSADVTTREGWGLPRGHRTATRSAWPHSASPARSGMGPEPGRRDEWGEDLLRAKVKYCDIHISDFLHSAFPHFRISDTIRYKKTTTENMIFLCFPCCCFKHILS